MNEPQQDVRSESDKPDDDFNTSGMGWGVEIPSSVKGWSWGALFLGWIWAVFNGTWIGLLCLVPYIRLPMHVFMGFMGREMAWRNKRWESVEHFKAVQWKWDFWGIVVAAVVAIFYVGFGLIFG